MHIRNIAVVGFGSLALVLGSSGAASAGEVTGKGKDTPAPERANSICVFSGLNDEITADEPGRTQTYGQIVAAGGKAFAPSPGVACNPNSGFFE